MALIRPFGNHLWNACEVGEQADVREERPKGELRYDERRANTV